MANRILSRGVRLCLLLGLVLLASPGCPTSGNSCDAGSCAQPSDGGSGASADGGPTQCKKDFDCLPLKNGSVCNSVSGECEVGVGCRDDAECQSLDSDAKCFSAGPQCMCDLRDRPAGQAGAQGTCRLRKGPCEECVDDRECGNDRVIFGPPGIGAGVCRALPQDTSGKKYCLYQKVGQCSCGTVDDGAGYCRPQSNSCTQVGCNVDKDCPGGLVCSVNAPQAGPGACGGVCVVRCRWDFRQKSLVEPGCPPNTTCWVDSQNLDPSSPDYGSGRCKSACQSDSDCASSAANPFGGDNLKCAGEALAGGGVSSKRCRAKGDCMDDWECPLLPADQPALGYCDRRAFVCKSDCRTEMNPATGRPFVDCRPPYACEASAGTNRCRLMTCVEQGGAALACSQGEYCCGDDKDRDGTPDPCPPASERNEVGCYKAPTPPFCQVCKEDDDECLTPALPSWLANACSNGSKSPSCSLLPPRCLYAGDKPGGKGVSICAPATWNDSTKDARGMPKDQAGCPVNYTALVVRPDRAESVFDYCESDADCNLGTDAGSCESDPKLRFPDGGMLKACRCTAGSGKSMCPNAPWLKVSSECAAGVSGARVECVESVVCMPIGNTAYKPVTEYGCGL